jgi:poly-gamma-glutamate capsule biosynthesis protein CapA/YwtB (metallophosphatase superfamily)
VFVPFSPLPPPSGDEGRYGRLVCVGDMICDREVRRVIRQQSAEMLLHKVREFLQGEIVIGNLECPLSHGGKPRSTTHSIFRGSPEVAPVLKESGFSALGLANNHIFDYGEDAAIDTFRTLQCAGLKPVGLQLRDPPAPAHVIMETPQATVSLLAYTPCWTVPPGDSISIGKWNPHRIKEDLQQAQDASDFCVVFFHFGEELVAYPPPKAREMAHWAIDVGAELVVGHHSHVLGGVELYKGKAIAYSLGDFIFDSDHPLRQQSIIMRFHFSPGGVAGIDYLPVSIKDCVPHPAEGQARTKVIQRLEGLSAGLQSSNYLELYYRNASLTFMEGQWEALKRAFKKREFYFLFQRLLHLEIRHVKLFFTSIITKLYGLTK